MVGLGFWLDDDVVGGFSRLVVRRGTIVRLSGARVHRSWSPPQGVDGGPCEAGTALVWVLVLTSFGNLSSLWICFLSDPWWCVVVGVGEEAG